MRGGIDFARYLNVSNTISTVPLDGLPILSKAALGYLVKLPGQAKVLNLEWACSSKDVSFAGMDIVAAGTLTETWCRLGWLKLGGKRVRNSCRGGQLASQSASYGEHF
eukprot:1160313-Pelagomonas_calceolata.AAC.3